MYGRTTPTCKNMKLWQLSGHSTARSTRVRPEGPTDPARAVVRAETHRGPGAGASEGDGSGGQVGEAPPVRRRKYRGRPNETDRKTQVPQVWKHRPPGSKMLS